MDTPTAVTFDESIINTNSIRLLIIKEDEDVDADADDEDDDEVNDVD